jgi:hypothetical protein
MYIKASQVKIQTRIHLNLIEHHIIAQQYSSANLFSLPQGKLTAELNNAVFFPFLRFKKNTSI